MPDSRAQVRAAHATLEGKSNILPQSVAKEIVAKMHGRKMSSLPEKVGKKKKGAGFRHALG